MKFCEAMDLLKSGSKITREPWKQGVYFLMVDNDVKSFQPKLAPYLYNEDIMISDGWIIDGREEEFEFCDLILYLVGGLRAWRKDWIDMFIYLDKDAKSLVIHSMDVFPFTPDFDSFTAYDWIELK